jgi:uroporphyrin-3 C-methyltransferase
MSGLENSLAALQGVSAGARDTWLLAEAEYYMQIANAQLQLGNNPRLAMLALGMADERVVQMANPGLTDVRRAIADELAALEVMEKPDIEGAALTLASLSRVVESLPLYSIDRAAGGDDAEIDPELSGTERAWESVKGAMSGLVRVTPPDEETRALLTPDAAQLIRSNLALQLQAARLALLRSEQAIFEQSLDDAVALIGDYFDTSSAQVDSALQTIGEIRGSMAAGSPPDISESLRLLRQYRTLAENRQ